MFTHPVRPPRSFWQAQLSVLQIGLMTAGMATLACPGWSLPSAVLPTVIDQVDQGRLDAAIELEMKKPASGDRHQAMGLRGRQPDVEKPASLSAAPIVPHSPPAIVQLPPPYSRLPTLHAELEAPAVNPAPSMPLDLDPNLIKNSPVLRRWLKQVPNVLADINHDPSFRTRLKLGYAQFPSTKQASGLSVGIEDVFLGRSGLTLSADYQTAFNNRRAGWGADLRYYVLPLGRYINIAPIVGYRHLETPRYTTDGVNVGLRLVLVPSRTGAADIAIMQSWVLPGGDQAVGLTTLSFGYALTDHVRLSTDIQTQNSRFRSDSRVGIGLEWMF